MRKAQASCLKLGLCLRSEPPFGGFLLSYYASAGAAASLALAALAFFAAAAFSAASFAGSFLKLFIAPVGHTAAQSPQLLHLP